MAINIPIISEFDGKGVSKAIKQFKQLETTGEKAQFAIKKAAVPAAAALAPNAANPIIATLAACCAAKPTLAVPDSRFLNSLRADFIPFPSNSVMIGIASAISQVLSVRV